MSLQILTIVLLVIAPCWATSRIPDNAEALPNEYIAVLKAELSPQLSSELGIEVKRILTLGSKQFAFIKGNDSGVKRLIDDGHVGFIEPNLIIHPHDSPMNKDKISLGSRAPLASTSGTERRHQTTRRNNNHGEDYEYCNLYWYRPAIDAWAMIRTSHRAKPIYRAHNNWGQPYITGLHDQGADTRIYIVDSGIYLEHPDFEGRAIAGMVAEGVGEPKDVDWDGHGTHVAGIAGGKRFGIARQSTLVSCKVFSAGGGGASLRQIIEAIAWAVDDTMKRRGDGNPGRSVINLSLGRVGIGYILAIAVQESIELGIPVVVSAGNDDAETCFQTPARVSDAITVGATDEFDELASFSNFGACTNILAPGVNVSGPLNNGTFGEEFPYGLMSGTSMSAPLVSGIVARHLSAMSAQEVSETSVAQIRAKLTDDASNGRIFYEGVERGPTPNLLLYRGCGDGDIELPPPSTTTTTTTTPVPPTTTQTTSSPAGETQGAERQEEVENIKASIELRREKDMAGEKHWHDMNSNPESLVDELYIQHDADTTTWTADAVSTYALVCLILICLTFAINVGSTIAIRKTLKKQEKSGNMNHSF